MFKSTKFNFTFLGLLSLFLFYFVNKEFIGGSFFEWGDLALQGIDTNRVQNFEIFIGTTSSQGFFRQPGPFLSYWLYLIEQILFLLNIKNSVFSHILGYVILNIFFQTVTLYIIYKNLKNKILILPIGVFFICFLNTIIEGQFSQPTVMAIGISAFIFFTICIADFMQNQNISIAPVVFTGYIILSNIHVIYFVLSTFILFFVFLYMYKNYYLFKNFLAYKISIFLSILVIFIGFLPIIYDQLFLTNNLSKIFFYGSDSPYQNNNSRLSLFFQYFPKSFQFIGMFFIDLFMDYSNKLSLIINKDYLLSPFQTIIFWSFYLFFIFYSFKNTNSYGNFYNKVLLLVSIVILFSIFFATGKTSAGKIYELEYTSRYILSFVFLFYLSIFLFVDNYLKSCKFMKIEYSKFLLSFVIIIFSLSFPQSKMLFDKKVGYFVIKNISISKDIENFSDKINISNHNINVFTDTDDWPLLAGLLYQLTKKNNRLYINNNRYTNMFKLPTIDENLNSGKNIFIMKNHDDCQKGVLVNKDGFNLCSF